MIGQSVLHYRIVEKVGEGGMGVVYKAVDTHLDRVVAVKALPRDATAVPDRKRRFVQEAKAASALNHPNIITVHDIASQDGSDFIIMEYVAGQTLQELIGGKPLTLKQALRIAIQMADALAAAHAAGIVHRDLKPGNIMATPQGLVKILDFGLAKLIEPRERVGPLASTVAIRGTETRSGTLVGTVAYMSPEQAEGRDVDSRSDIFAFGAVLYEMLTGRRAFAGETPMSTLAAVLQKEPPALSGIVAGVPPELEQLVTRCLRKDRTRRFQHILDVKLLLEELAEGLGQRSRNWTSRRRAWVLALASAPLLAFTLWIAIRPERVEPVPRTVPLTSFPGEEYDPALSPDGKQVAFAWNGPGGDNHDIYIKLVDAGTPLRITSNPAVETSPSWSPDGRFIAFYRDNASARDVIVVPALGGPERHVGVSRGRTHVASLGWKPDGKTLLIVDQSAPEEPLGIFSLSLDTGEKRNLTTSPAGTIPGDTRFALSPDGRALAFLRLSGSQFGHSLYLLELTNGGARGEPFHLRSSQAGIAGLDWSADGRSIIFSARGGNQHLWRISARTRGGPPDVRPFSAVGEHATTVSVARQGHRLAYTRYVFDINIWRVAAGLRTTSEPARLVASTREDRMPAFSPDGKRIAFISERSGHREVWVSNADGTTPVQLTNLDGPSVMTPRWSADGRQIAFAANPGGDWNIHVVPSDGGAAHQVIAGSGDELFPCWSQDGRSIYFASNRSGKRQIWRAPVAGGSAVQVTRNGANQSIEARSGDSLYYTRQNDEGIWTVPVTGGNEVQVLELGDTYNWTLSQRGLYLLRAGAKPGPAIEFYPFGSRRGTRVAALPKGSQVRDIAVSPDGHSILYARAEQPESDIMLVENFR